MNDISFKRLIHVKFSLCTWFIEHFLSTRAIQQVTSLESNLVKAFGFYIQCEIFYILKFCNVKFS